MILPVSKQLAIDLTLDEQTADLLGGQDHVARLIGDKPITKITDGRLKNMP